MKRSILLFLILYFSILFRLIFAQSDQKSVIISGYVSYEGRSAQQKNVEVRIANTYTKPIKANADGFFNIRWDCLNDNDYTYLLLYRTAEHCAKIIPINMKNYANIKERLKLAFLAPKSIEINIQGNVRDNEGEPIDSASVYLDNGITFGFTDPLGHFDIVADKKNISSNTLLWIEKNSYKRKIFPINFNGSIDDTSFQDIILEPINKEVNLECFVIRKGLKRQPINDVLISINDSNIGRTNEKGIFSVDNFRIKDSYEFINVKFNHRYYIPQFVNYYLCDNIFDIYITVELEPLLRNLECKFYQTDSSGNRSPIDSVSIILDQNVPFYIDSSGMAKLKILAVPNDTLHIRLPLYTDSSGMAKLKISAVPNDTLHIRLPQNMFCVPEDTFLVIQEERSFYELVVRKKSKNIEISQEMLKLVNQLFMWWIY